MGGLIFDFERISGDSIHITRRLLKSPFNDFDIKLADFGFAKKVEGKSLDTQCGTPGYVAPEILKGKKYGTAVDMWSCGVIVYILLGGYPPFHDDNHAILYRKIKAADYAFDIRVEIYIAKDPFVDLDAVEQMRQTEQTPRRWHGVDGASRAGSTRSTGTRCPMMRRT